MPLHKQKKDEVFQNLIEHVVWMTAERDDTLVLNHLFQTKSMDSVYGLDEAVLFDYLFNFMDEQEITAFLTRLAPIEGEVQREMLTGFQIVILYLMKCVKGIRSMNACEDILFTDEFAMRLAGFNAMQTRRGICQRGKNKGTRGFADLRGLINNDTLANNIVKFSPESVCKCYNQIIKRLARNGAFPKNVHAVLDCTEIETTADYEGRGEVLKEKAVAKRGTHHEKKQVIVYGFKLWVVYVPGVEIPIALYVDKIQVHDIQHARKVVDQAIINLGDHAKIKSLAVDRGFLDGKFLWGLSKIVDQFFIPAKKNLTICQEILMWSKDAESVTREKNVTHGQGKNKHTETQVVELKAVNDISCDWYNALGSEANSCAKDFVPGILHAVHVVRDDGYAHNRIKNTIFLTNKPIQNPFYVYDKYDDRSLIENELNRTAKQTWFIENPPKKTADAVKLHIYFVMISMAMASAFRGQQKDEKVGFGVDTGMERYRRKLRAANQDNCAIFVGDKYGIFIAYEPFVVMDITVTEAQQLGATKEVILKKYGVIPPSPE